MAWGRMRAPPLGPSEKLRMGSGQPSREGCAAVRLRWAFGRTPYGAKATILVRGVPKLGLGPHAGPATGTSGRAPHAAKATILVRGVPKWGVGGPSVELPVERGPRSS